MTNNQDEAAGLGTADVVCMADVVTTAIEWLWKGRVPRGMLTVLDGDPGLGKSMMVLDMAARISSGRPMPFADDARPPENVLLLLAEDHLSGTVRPRLDAAGASQDRVFVWDSVTVKGVKRAVSFPDDLLLLRREIERRKAAFVAIDPLMAFLGTGVDSHSDQSIRTLLYQFKLMTEATGCTMQVLRHLNKSGGGKAIYRGNSSIGIIGAARSGLLAAKAPNDQEGFVLAPTKNNVGPLAPSLRYHIEPHGLVGKINWDGECDLTADELLAPPERPAQQQSKAEAFLKQQLAAGPKQGTAVYDEADVAGLSKRTVDRAKAALGVTSRPAGFQGPVMWSLPVVATGSLHQDSWQPLDDPAFSTPFDHEPSAN